MTEKTILRVMVCRFLLRAMDTPLPTLVGVHIAGRAKKHLRITHGVSWARVRACLACSMHEAMTRSTQPFNSVRLCVIVVVSVDKASVEFDMAAFTFSWFDDFSVEDSL
mgnify:CR=1 FL=1